ncbi:MAG TPA: GNAT family N-acetyltransferase [Chitinophagaceae bacterium]|nr:GNAT family N-acetyltransferase [Chitinophagaceae bacterium]
MLAQEYRLHKLKENDRIPFELLLLADETEDAINKYIYHSDIYTVYILESLIPIGVFALYRISNLVIEIKNIGVSEKFRSKGVGSGLIKKIKEIAAEENYEEIIVGTPDSGVRQIRFYEKNGFRRYGVKKNFFIENYPEPISEDGIILKDMIMLKAKTGACF